MGSTNFGTQIITFQYAEVASSPNFNSLNYKLFPAGIYEGGLVTRLEDTTARIAPLTAYLYDSVKELGVRIETTLDVDKGQAVSSSPYLIISYAWVASGNNFADILWATTGEATATDVIIIGKANFDGAIIDVSDPFDFTTRVEVSLGTGITYLPTKYYHTDAIVTFEGVMYLSLVDDNYGNTPDSSSSEWKPLHIVTATSATSFPGSPFFAQEVYRSDLDKWYKYNGTIWMEF